MWILPTRGRPESCQAVLDACVRHGVSTPGIVIVNDDDPRYDALRLPDGWRAELQPGNLGLCASMNHVVQTHPNEPWYGLLGDDIFPETDGWDRKLIEAIGPNRFGNCHDGWSPEWKMCGIEVWGGDLVRAAGWLAIPGLWHCFWDDFWELVARQIGGRVVVPDVKCRSPHQFTQTQERDETFYLSYSKLNVDQQVYNRWLETDEASDTMARLRLAINGDRSKRFSLQGKSLYIALPCLDGNVASAYLKSFSKSVRLFHKHGVPYELQILEKCSILPHVRNRLCAHFLRSGKSHMLFIDADMGWEPHAPLELLAHDKDVIAAVGFTKNMEDFRPCAELDKNTQYDKETGLLTVKHVGTGFMMISRECLLRFAEHYKDRAYRDVRNPEDPIVPRWFEHDLDSEDWGEDLTFCRRWREMGGEIWVNPSITIAHVGNQEFTGRYSDWLRAVSAEQEARRESERALAEVAA